MGEESQKCDGWVSAKDRTPPEDTPVWMYLPDIKQPVIGCVSDVGNGQEWGMCYDDYYFDPKEKIWKAYTCDAEDYHPTHWKLLPNPPGGES